MSLSWTQHKQRVFFRPSQKLSCKLVDIPFYMLKVLALVCNKHWLVLSPVMWECNHSQQGSVGQT